MQVGLGWTVCVCWVTIYYDIFHTLWLDILWVQYLIKWHFPSSIPFRSHRHNTVLSHPNGSTSIFNSPTNGNSNAVNPTSGTSIQQSSNNPRLSVPSAKNVAENVEMKPSNQTSQNREMTQINHKSQKQKQQQQILINQNNTTDVPNLHQPSQVKVNSCESSVNNEIVNASSKLDMTSSTVSSCNEHDAGMITIVTINNNSNNLDNLSKLINDGNTLVWWQWFIFVLLKSWLLLRLFLPCNGLYTWFLSIILMLITRNAYYFTRKFLLFLSI